jgi:VIT1/CCC1 family predicted Fe2+/Mn2+ transporter
MNKPLKPAWKVALWTLLASFGIMMALVFVIAATSASGNRREVRRKIAQQSSPFLIFAPLVAYVVQKSRIDSAKRG